MARRTEISEAQMQAIAQHCFAELDERVIRPPLSGDGPTLWRLEQRALAEDRIDDLCAQADDRDFDGLVRRSLVNALAVQRLEPGDLTEGSLQDAYDAVLRAFVEDQRRYIHRVTQPLADYHPDDSLLQGIDPAPRQRYAFDAVQAR